MDAQKGCDDRLPNLLAIPHYLRMKYPDMDDGPDQTGHTREEDIQMQELLKAKQGSVRINEVLTFIEHGSQRVISDEYTVPSLKEPNRLFPTSDVLDEKVEHTFRAKDKRLPDISMKRDKETGSHFDPHLLFSFLRLLNNPSSK